MIRRRDPGRDKARARASKRLPSILTSPSIEVIGQTLGSDGDVEVARIGVSPLSRATRCLCPSEFAGAPVPARSTLVWTSLDKSGVVPGLRHPPVRPGCHILQRRPAEAGDYH
jgi:hypothetical protein